MSEQLDEAAYIRAIEDFFATARGVQHMLSSKDTHLVLTWWRDGVPLAAITAGIAEVFARRRQQDDGDPTTSLTYCRHAVKKQAKHFAEMRVGAHDDDEAAEEIIRSDIERLVSELETTAKKQQDDRPQVAEVISTIASQVRQSSELPPATLDEQLFALQSTLLEGCMRALPQAERETIEADAKTAAEASGALGDALGRMTKAMADRSLRSYLDLPLLAIG